MSGQYKHKTSKGLSFSTTEIADCFGPGPWMFFNVDSLSKPGYLIFHLVRFNTLVIKDDGHFDQAELKSLHLENDPRLRAFAKCLHVD